MRRFLSLLAGVLCAIPLAAQITLPPQIGDYMVLQQQAQVCLWGWAPPGGKVSVSTSWDKAGYTVTASSDGAWKVSVQTPEGSFQEQSIRIQCRGESRVLEHVLIGEVWMASGQSNMEMPLRGFDNCPVEGGPQEIVQAGRYKGRIRFVTLPKTEAYSPRERVDAVWKESLPEHAPEFGAAAWFFARNLAEALDVPVGIINNAWGGSRVEGWLPKEVVDAYPGLPVDSLECRKIMLSMSRPTIMYYGQWCPVRNYTFKGILWYQGEANVDQDPDAYVDRMETLIGLWRKETGNPALPVYQVEIAPYALYGGAEALDGAVLREHQRQVARETENCWIASTADLALPYESAQIHPARKREVGERLSYLALHHTYGQEPFAGYAPEYASMDIIGSEVALSFSHLRESGGFNRLEGLQGFEICGPDLKWYPAQAHVRNFYNKVIVSHPEVDTPVAVRYAFRNWLPGNLSGANGLAVPPFRTDRLLEGEIPTGLSSEPDGDFTGHWTGEVNLPQMGDAHLVFDYRLSHDGNGRWTCRLPDGSVTPVSVNGRKMTGLSVQTGSVDLPIDLKSTDDGTVLVEIMGNPLTTLIREVL